MQQTSSPHIFTESYMTLPKSLRLWGIGGVGMSALAQHLLRSGHHITGYDREASPFTAILERQGISIDYTPRPTAISAVEGVIYTPAIPEDFPEWEAVKAHNLPVWRRAEALSMVLEPYQVLAVAGAHGKTTTAAILTWLLYRMGESPTAFVGGLMKNFDNNYLAGSSPLAVVEADEYDRAMLRLHPAHAIIQSTDPDHLEIYGSAEALLNAYRQFARQVQGELVLGREVPELGRSALRYEVERYEAVGDEVHFTYRWRGGRRVAHWRQIGRHFAENAAAALTLLEALGYSFDRLQIALSEYTGVARRLEIYPAGRHVVVSDYAHHPTEIRRTLEALREAYPKHKLIAVFQPHLHSRTAFFAQDFAQVLSQADYVVLFPIYAAREPSTSSISEKLISQHLAVPFEEVIPLGIDMEGIFNMPYEQPSVVAFLGAGDIYLYAGSMQKALTKLS